MELPFQQGAPLQVDDQKINSSECEIFMAIISEPEDQKDDPTE
jgi:hypothetical protein